MMSKAKREDRTVESAKTQAQYYERRIKKQTRLG